MAKAKLDINGFIARTDALTKDYDNYTDQFVTRAHKELYALLANIYQVCLDVIHNPNHAELRKLMRTRMKESLNTRISNETRTVPLVVRYITRASAKTRHVYSRVFETAIEAGIAAEKLPAFIEEHGGIDKAHKATTVPVTAPKYTKADMNKALEEARNQLAVKLARERNIGTVNFSKCIPAISSDVEYWHVLCRFDSAQKRFVIDFAAYPSKTLEQDALHMFVTALNGACMANKHGFKEHCKELGLHDDHVLRWMESNGIKDAEHAEQLFKFYTQEANKAAAAIDGKKNESRGEITAPLDNEPEVIDVECHVITATETA